MDRMNGETGACAVCGSREMRVAFERPGETAHHETVLPTTDLFHGYGTVVVCGSCGTLRRHPAPDWGRLRTAYEASEDPHYLVEYPGRAAAARRVLKFLERTTAPGRLLDVGCGVGVLLKEASPRWQGTGVELSRWAANRARERFGLDVREGTVTEAGLPAGTFAAAVFLDVIEHLPDPRGALREAARLLKPGGALCVYTPDAGAPVARLMGRWWWGLRPAHLHYFTGSSISRLLGELGFDVKEVRHTGRTFTFGYWLSRMRGYAPRLVAALGAVLRWTGLGRIPLRLNTFDSMMVLAILRGRKTIVKDGKKIAAVMPAYNAERTLERTYNDIPGGLFDSLILVDDASRDRTVEIARKLGLTVIVHPKNRGYGGNQKTCYRAALDAGADIIVMIHPDYQYDPTLAPELVAPILEGRADCVLGSRMMGDTALKGKMPVWKYVGNKFLTGIENACFGARFSEYHTGYRAYARKVLESLPLELNSDDFVFDQEIIAQMLSAGYRIAEVPIPTRYFKEASSVSFTVSVKYGLQTLALLVSFLGLRIFGARSRKLTPL
jgi:SAM-dependent methyltransferase